LFAVYNVGCAAHVYAFSPKSKHPSSEVLPSSEYSLFVLGSILTMSFYDSVSMCHLVFSVFWYIDLYQNRSFPFVVKCTDYAL
jgi:hypothetical protein